MLIEWLSDLVSLFNPTAPAPDPAGVKPFYFSESFWAAILGTLAGALPTVFISIWLHNRVRKDNIQDRESEKRARSLEAALSLLLKLFKIEQRLLQIRNHNDEGKKAFEKADRKFVRERWQTLQPIANKYEIIHFTSVEMQNLLAIGGGDLFSDLRTLDDCYNTVVQLLEAYERVHTELSGQLAPAQDDGKLGTFYATENEIAQLRPMMMQLNSIIDGFDELCADYADWAERSVKDLSAAMDKKALAELKLQYDFDPDRVKKRMKAKNARKDQDQGAQSAAG